MRERDGYDAILESVVYIPEHPTTEVPGMLYTVTTIARSQAYGGDCTPIVCSSLAKAKEVVESNHGDIWEHSYMLCVIEGVIPDVLYSSTFAPRFWYAWNEKAEGSKYGKYCPIECPEAYKRRFGFGIG